MDPYSDACTEYRRQQQAWGSSSNQTQIAPVVQQAQQNAQNQDGNTGMSPETIRGLMGLGTAGIGALRDIVQTVVTQGNTTERARLAAEVQRYLGQNPLALSDPTQTSALSALMAQLQIQNAANAQPNWGVIAGVAALAVAGVGVLVYTMSNRRSGSHSQPRANPVVMRHGNRMFVLPRKVRPGDRIVGR